MALLWDKIPMVNYSVQQVREDEAMTRERLTTIVGWAGFFALILLLITTKGGR